MFKGASATVAICDFMRNRHEWAWTSDEKLLPEWTVRFVSGSSDGTAYSEAPLKNDFLLSSKCTPASIQPSNYCFSLARRTDTADQWSDDRFEIDGVTIEEERLRLLQAAAVSRSHVQRRVWAGALNRSGLNMADLDLASAILLTLLAPVTVVSNGLLLVAIWQDPLKCFKTATTYFVIGLSLADMTTGLTVEPFFAVFYFVRYTQGGEQALTYATLSKAGSTISTVAICYSFLIVLALSWSQFIAITWPHSYKRIVTTRNVTLLITASFLYLLTFTLILQYAGLVDEVTFLKIQLAAHASFLSVNLIVISVLLSVAFRRRVSSRAAAASTRSARVSAKRDKMERQFTALAMYLAAILLLAALPHVCIAQLYLYLAASFSDEVRLRFVVALRVSDLLLFVKVCLDPFIYAWRLPHYRRALRQIFSACCHRRKRKEKSQKSGSNSSSGLLTVRQATIPPRRKTGAQWLWTLARSAQAIFLWQGIFTRVNRDEMAGFFLLSAGLIVWLA